MSYEDNCEGGYVNYYSNPDVIYLGKPTGTETENCAWRIRDTMVRHSHGQPPHVAVSTKGLILIIPA